MNTKKFEQGGMVETLKEIEQQETIKILSTACVQVDLLINKYCEDTNQRKPNAETKGSPAYYLKRAIDRIKKS